MVAEEEGRKEGERREERGNRRGIDLVICLAFVADSPNSVRSIRPFVACDGKGWVSGLRSQVIGKAVRACVRARLQAACVSTWYDLG